MAQLIKSDAIILHSIRWQESSKIITVYSREWGKIGLIARGALRPKSTLAGLTESLNYVHCVVSNKAERNLQILTSIDVIDSFNHLRLEITRLPYALAIIELLNQVIEEHESNPVFFDFTIEMIQNIGKAKSPQIVFWYFLLKLSSFLGFRPQLQKCHVCENERLTKSIQFNLHLGTIYCQDCYANSAGGMKLTDSTWQFLRQLQTYPHKRILDLAENSGSKLNLTPMLIQYLNIHLDKDITAKSLQLLI